MFCVCCLFRPFVCGVFQGLFAVVCLLFFWGVFIVFECDGVVVLVVGCCLFVVLWLIVRLVYFVCVVCVLLFFCGILCCVCLIVFMCFRFLGCYSYVV